MSDEIIRILNDQSNALGRIEASLANVKEDHVTLKSDVDDLKRAKTYAMGFGAGLISIEGALHYILHKFGAK